MSEAFSTRIDLIQHMQDLHNARTKHYCTLGACGSKKELWVSAAHFSQHLMRVHGLPICAEDDLGAFVYKDVEPFAQPSSDEKGFQYLQNLLSLEGLDDGSEDDNLAGSFHELSWDIFLEIGLWGAGEG